MNNDTSIRLNKYISESGMCSRREADRFIEQGKVFINGQKAKIGRQVFPGDSIVVNGNEIEAKKEADAIYIAFNKPPGITCTTTHLGTPRETGISCGCLTARSSATRTSGQTMSMSPWGTA